MINNIPDNNPGIIFYLFIAFLTVIGISALQQITLDKLLHRVSKAVVITDIYIESNERSFARIPDEKRGNINISIMLDKYFHINYMLDKQYHRVQTLYP